MSAPYHNDIMRFADAVQSADRPDDILSEVERGLEGFGFTSFVIMRAPRLGETFRDGVLLHRAARQFFETYMREDFAAVDPVVQHLRRRSTPFAWSEAPFDAKDEAAMRVMRTAAAHGLNDGFCLPRFGPHGFEGHVTIGGKDVDLTNRARVALHLITSLAFDRTSEIVQKANDALPLTPREIEIVKMTADGMGAAEVADILGISKRTVDMHIGHVCDKLQARNKTHAVALAIKNLYVNG